MLLPPEACVYLSPPFQLLQLSHAALGGMHVLHLPGRCCFRGFSLSAHQGMDSVKMISFVRS